jgi:hypothetical protein
MDTDGQRLKALDGVRALGFNPDGRFVIGTQYDDDYKSEIVMFDIEDGFAQRSLISYDRVYDIRTERDRGVFLTLGCTDSYTFESGFTCVRGTTEIWDTNGDHIGKLKETDLVTEAQFVPHSDRITSTGSDIVVTYIENLPIVGGSVDGCVHHSIKLHDYNGN